MIINDLVNKRLIHPPSWLPTNVHFLTCVGSIAYGAADTTVKSDMDICGFCTPRKEIIFPHLAGAIPNFGSQPPRFDQWQEHHVFDKDALGGRGREYDFSVYSIVKYFDLLMKSNPTLIDSIFTPRECILHITEVGNMVRDNRKIFLHRGCWATFKGYAMSQLHKMSGHERTGKRKEIYEKYKYDLKFALHVVRLLYEAEMILSEGDLDLRRYSEHLKEIRRGKWTEEQVRRWASEKEFQLEKVYAESKLPQRPDEAKIKQLLLDCLEHHYGSLSGAIVVPGKHEQVLKDIKTLIEKAGI